MGQLDGKVAIVTGAGRGIGRAEALLLAAEGAAVVVNDLGGEASGEGADQRPAQQVADEIVAAGGRAVANYDNIASWDGGQALVAQAVDELGDLDILINNAGILRDKMSFNMTEEEWDAVIDVHLKGHFVTSRFASAYWRQQSKDTGAPVEAAIVNTASESGLYGNAGQVNYAAAKAGIASMTIVMARELERIGVRVNAIAPIARTRLTEGLAGDMMNAKEGEFDRFAPENPAAVAVWLASPRAAGITGQVVKVQGGLVQLLRGWRPITQATGDDDLDPRVAQLGPGRPGRRQRHGRPPVHAPARGLGEDRRCTSRGVRRRRRSAPSSSRSSTSTRPRRRGRGATSRRTSRGEHPDELIPQWARDWQATLFDHGWMIPGYPPELGGRNATPVQTLVYLEEMANRGIPRSLHFPGYAIVAPTLLDFGSPAAAGARARGHPGRHRVVHRHERAERGLGPRRALRRGPCVDGDRFVVNGQKVWTSYAMDAQLCCCYVRTDPDAPKHQGISLLIVDMSTPGIEIRPLRHLTGAADFAEVFFTDVEVPRENLVGDLNDGWRLTQGSLAHERGRAVGRERGPARAEHRGPRGAGARRSASTATRWCGGSSARRRRRRRRCARSGTRASPRSRRARPRRSTRT